ncbi:peptidoglycan recognition protein family protein [Streptomyces millisiae]|uniref:Peptidoglycan recognition protein n=1 Tax=Streptomyces millisiae TaxID=3075542 RepID=A0ABU2LXG6_9ACTN|nr:peptidoglycan recognition protein [Streptomyces sp. DSM 44918]MDT0321733.1 peptidoglycan recognition protein [Streptomyces sp. DSM 44918]
MRALLASIIGTACSAALLTAPALATGQPSTAPAPPPAGGRQSLALEPLAAIGPARPPEARPKPEGGGVERPERPERPEQPEQPPIQGLPATGTEPFSLLGVVWTDPTAPLNGEVRVRTRDADTGDWSEWRRLAVGPDHAPDPDSAEATGGTLRGGTAPLWVGPSDGVQVRVLPAAAGDDEAPADELPAGLRLELVDPGTDDASGADDAEDVPGSGARLRAEDLTPRAATAAGAHEAARPPIVTRAGWGADESLRESGYVYTDTVTTVFVHHTGGGNDYSCSEAPSLIRGIYRYHVESQGWRDVGYNFFVDKCGTVYEGRAGGVAEPVQGAHTLGFNHNSTGVAVLGTYSDTGVSAEARDALSRLVAWKLGLHDGDPSGASNRTSSGGQWPSGTTVKLDNVSGHQDAYATDCPGAKLYDQLPTIRSAAAELQGR